MKTLSPTTIQECVKTLLTNSKEFNVTQVMNALRSQNIMASRSETGKFLDTMVSLNQIPGLEKTESGYKISEPAFQKHSRRPLRGKPLLEKLLEPSDECWEAVSKTGVKHYYNLIFTKDDCRGSMAKELSIKKDHITCHRYQK